MQVKLIFPLNLCLLYKASEKTAISGFRKQTEGILLSVKTNIKVTSDVF